MKIETDRFQIFTGTEWPVFYTVTKFDGKWCLAEVCNGSADKQWEFRTKREAVDFARARG